MKDVKAILDEAVRLKLHGVEDLVKHPIECLGTDYNGIGPSCFPEKLREYLDSLAPAFQPAALIHDFRWSHSDGSEAAFEASNLELEMNCNIIAKQKPVWHPQRYLMLWSANTFVDIVKRFGWIAYQFAYTNQEEKPNE